MSEEDYSTRIWKFLLVTLLIAFGVRTCLFGNSDTHRGEGFSIIFPDKWIEWDMPEAVRKQQPEMLSSIYNVTYVTPEKDLLDGAHEASISVISYKLSQAIWLEDEFPRIRSAIERQGHKVIKDGQIKLDGEISNWIFYHDLKNEILNMEFYIVTTSNMFFKIHYAAKDTEFKKHRQAFEQSKDTFKITGFRI